MPYKDYKKQMNLYMKRRWKLRREIAVAFLGGRCANCGTVEALEFDHIDPTTKIKTIAKFSSASELKFWAEVKKCQLLCESCHNEKTKLDFSLGTVAQWVE